VEAEIASVVGWERVLGCVASRFQVEALEPGHVRRTNAAGGADYVVFRVGEVHGRVTARARETRELLQSVDSAKVTTNLSGERWSKLVANAMTSAACGVSGLSFKQMYQDPSACRVIARLAQEAIDVGRALGFELEAVHGHPPARYLEAAGGDVAALEALATGLRASLAGSLEGGRSGIAQDLAKGRRTEVDDMNGYVASKAADAGVDVPTQRAITAMVHAIERGELRADTRNLDELLRDHVSA
jgi:2-dehydropantoate 2-reductase